MAGFVNAAPGELLAVRDGALLRRTRDGGVWIGHVRRVDTAAGFKQVAAQAFAAEAAALPVWPAPLQRPEDEWGELRYTEHGPDGARVGCLHFDFHNGAMSTERCERLRAAWQAVRERPVQVLLLMGGEDFFSNGIDLNAIEAAAHRPGDSAADASWRNIQAMNDTALELRGFLDAVFTAPPARVDGTAVFLTAQPGVVPNALLHNLKHNKVLHEHNLFVTVRHHDIPWVSFDQRISMESLGHDCWQVMLNFGFKNEPDVPQALQLLAGRGVPLDEMDTSYFLSRDIVMPTIGDGMSLWREKLFANMHRNAAAAADFLNLPTNRVVELGSKVEI